MTGGGQCLKKNYEFKNGIYQILLLSIRNNCYISMIFCFVSIYRMGTTIYYDMKIPNESINLAYPYLINSIIVTAAFNALYDIYIKRGIYIYICIFCLHLILQ